MANFDVVGTGTFASKFSRIIKRAQARRKGRYPQPKTKKRLSSTEIDRMILQRNSKVTLKGVDFGVVGW